MIACICGCKCMCVWYMYVYEIVHVYRYMWMYIWHICVYDGSHVWMLCVFAQMFFVWSNTGKRFHWNFCKLVKESQSFSWSSQFYTILITLVYFTESWKWQANTHPYITMHSWYRIKVKNLNVLNLNGQNTHSKRHKTLSCLTQQDWSSL